ncbi:uncharacterized protein [Argopecten irradians]|uniref:uncharacterized protein n=1 Tax=Argopecten irradians TaxID=31199 RepID=UPI00372331A7
MALNIKQLTHKIVQEVVQKSSGRRKTIHKLLCELSGHQPEQLNSCSVSNKAKIVAKEIQRLKNARNCDKLHTYEQKHFVFPPLRAISSQPKENNDTMQKKILSLQRVLTHVHMQLTRLKQKIHSANIPSLRLKIKRQQASIQKLKAKERQKATPVPTHQQGTQCNIPGTGNDELMKQLKTEIHLLQNEHELLQDPNNNSSSSSNNNGIPLDQPHFIVRDNTKGRPYNEKIRALYFKFRNCNVGMKHIATLIASVLNLVGIDITEKDLPSQSLATEFTTEMAHVNRQHLSQHLQQTDNVTMHRDATTKKGRHFYGVELTSENKTVTLGLKEVADGKGETFFNSCKQMCDDITDGVHHPIEPKIKNFMTDRSATETKVNHLINQEFGTDHERNEFKCAVHPLLQFSDTCEKEIKNIEKDLGIKSSFGGGKMESVTTNFLRCVSKLFFKDGSGDPLLVSLYLKEKNIPIPVKNFRGNRFNILFHNAAATFFLSPYLREYFVNCKTTLNMTQHFILNCLTDSNIMNICQCLGIISKLITEPYWIKAGNEIKNALEMTPVYYRMVEIFKEGASNPQLFFHNNIRPVSSTTSIRSNFTQFILYRYISTFM